jgi:hypothetical protein
LGNPNITYETLHTVYTVHTTHSSRKPTGWFIKKRKERSKEGREADLVMIGVVQFYDWLAGSLMMEWWFSTFDF